MLTDGKQRADAALRLVLIYGIFAGLWILLSDNALVWLFSDPLWMSAVGTIKGWLFVVVTSLLLYGLLRRLLSRIHAVSQGKLEALQEKARTKQLLDLIAASSLDAIFAKDRDGRYLLCNPAAARALGKPAGQIVGSDDTALFPPAQAEMIRANDRRVMAENRISSYDETLWTAGGVTIYQSIKGPLHDGDGQVVGIFGIARDITERKNAEARLEQALIAAQSATRAKSEFLAHMSHEIRTPINAIVGAARLIEYEPLSERQLVYSEIMSHSSQSLLALIDDILDLSKIEAGQIVLEPATFALVPMLNCMLAAATVSAVGKGLEISLDLAPDLPQLLIGDTRRLEQVLNNLLSNAVKFTAQGKIILRVRQLAASVEDVRLFFVVSDTGIGISPEQLDVVFAPFVQAEITTTRQYGGAGLGLAISRSLVELMGGAIEVESAPGQGSDFSFTALFRLPSVAQAAAALSAGQQREAACRPSASPLAGRRVLMVEDNAFNRIVLEGMLQHLGIEVDVALDGHDGLECFQVGSPYDLVLMDLHLPGLDGFACARAIRALPEGRQIPIIAVTANVLSTTVTECHAAGMNDHLQKPVEPETLQRSLMRWILGEQALIDLKPRPVGKAVDPADRLPDALPGIDLAKASAWSNGSARSLAKLLDRALTHAGDDPAKLARHIANGELDAAAQITHDLVGVAATVGASALVAAARLLNREIRAGSPDSAQAREAIDGIQAEFGQLRLAREMLQNWAG